jgi:hypothetical protein
MRSGARAPKLSGRPPSATRHGTRERATSPTALSLAMPVLVSQRLHLVHVRPLALATQGNDEGEPYRRFRRGDRQGK